MNQNQTGEGVEVKKLRAEIHNLKKVINEKNVIIDTAQAALRRAEGSVPDELKGHVFNQSAKWVMSIKL